MANEEVETFCKEKYGNVLERLVISMKPESLQATCVCKFIKRHRVYLDSSDLLINGKAVNIKTTLFADKHRGGKFDQLWKNSQNSNTHVYIFSSPEYQSKSELQQIVEMDDPNAALLEMWKKDQKKALGSGLATNQKNIKLIKEVLHATSLPEFKWNFPEHLLSTDTCYLPQEELNFIQRWFTEECEPEHKTRRKALVLFSEGREYGKSTFARTLVSEFEDYYIEIGGVSMTEQNFACKTKAKLFIVDDMEIDIRKYLEMWKKLLSSQRVNLRDCYFNQEFPGGIPVVMTTNNKKIFYQLAESPLFEDQCYFLSLSEFMGPLGCKPSSMLDDRSTKRRKYHCGKHCSKLAPLTDFPVLSQEGSDSRRFVDAVKKEEWSDCYKSCSEEEKQVFLTKFAEIQAEVERLKILYLQQPVPQPINNIFNIGSLFSQNISSSEIPSRKIHPDHRIECSNSLYELERISTTKKKQFRAHEEDGKQTTVPSRKDCSLINSNNKMTINHSFIPGVRFDGQQIQKVVTGTEFFNEQKLRRLLTWSKKRVEAANHHVEEEAAAEWGKSHHTNESKDRQSFVLFHAYFLCCKKTGVRIQPQQELAAVETSYFPAKRMKRSKQGKFGRVYGGAYYQNTMSSGTMQIFEKRRRAYLCEDIYWDLDQVNSHPSLLISLIMHLNLSVPKLLQEYIENREGVLGQIAVSYETDQMTAKNLMIRLMYGGTVKNWVAAHKLGLPSDVDLDQKLTQFSEDLTSINEKLQKLPLFAKALEVYHATYEKSEKTRTSFLSLICSEYERQVLLFVKLWLSKQTPQRHLDVLIHDGGLMRRLPGETEPPQQLLTNLNQELMTLFKTAHIKYAYKKFSNVLATEIDQEEPLYF